MVMFDKVPHEEPALRLGTEKETQTERVEDAPGQRVREIQGQSGLV